MSLYTYSPSHVTISLGGLHTVIGYAEGQFIRLARNSQTFQTQRAMDGTVERIYQKDDSYTIEIILAQSSPSNNILSALYNIDLATRMAKFPLIIKDTSGNTSFFAATTWIESLPEVVFAGGMELRTWHLSCNSGVLHVGGNAETSDIEDMLYAGSSLLPVLRSFGLGG